MQEQSEESTTWLKQMSVTVTTVHVLLCMAYKPGTDIVQKKHNMEHSIREQHNMQ